MDKVNELPIISKNKKNYYLAIYKIFQYISATIWGCIIGLPSIVFSIILLGNFTDSNSSGGKFYLYLFLMIILWVFLYLIPLFVSIKSIKIIKKIISEENLTGIDKAIFRLSFVILLYQLLVIFKFAFYFIHF